MKTARTLLLLSAVTLSFISTSSSQEVMTNEAAPGGLTPETAIVINEPVAPESHRKQIDYIKKKFPGARFFPEEDEVSFDQGRWIHGRVFFVEGQRKKLYFDISAANKQSEFRVQDHFVIAATRPPYPAAARQHRLEGNGVFSVAVGAGGEVQDVKVFLSTGHKILDAAAMDSLKEWRFKPEAKPFTAQVPCNFKYPSAGPSPARPAAPPAKK